MNMANFVKVLGQILVTEGSEGLEARERSENWALNPGDYRRHITLLGTASKEAWDYGGTGRDRWATCLLLHC